MQALIILGRQPALGLAELESLYGPDALRPVGDQAVAIDLPPPEINVTQLGGMVKFAKVLTVLDTIKWGGVQKFLEATVPEHLGYLPEGKLRMGLSAYGLDISPKRLQAAGLSLKKVIKATGRSVRYVPNVEPALNAAQILHNQLTGPLGWELLFVRDGNQTIIAQTLAVQDIDAYRRRDQMRPYRDARVGMLPPKLAQIIINLAVGYGSEDHHFTMGILDPFCGTGVILQEAYLMGYDVYGSDIDPRMVDYTDKNLMWLGASDPKLLRLDKNNRFFELIAADATNHTWQFNEDFRAIASETYLGRALTSLPEPSALQKIVQDCDTIHKKFLKNVARQTSPGFRLCLAIPAWSSTLREETSGHSTVSSDRIGSDSKEKTGHGFKHLPMLDSLGDLGYNRIKFAHATDQELIYHRPGQTVGRELVVLTRK